MKTTWKSRPILVVIVVMLLTLVGCSGDSPTEPSKPGAGTPTPGANDVVITFRTTGVQSDANNTTTTLVEATVTVGGSPAIDGTAVEFETSGGTFLETGTTAALRTTTDGIAFVHVVLTDLTPTTVSARVGIVVNTVEIQGEIPAPEGAPNILTISPSTGSPSGGEIITISGDNFVAPVTVFFGSSQAVVASQTFNEIKVVLPATDLGPTEQSSQVNVKVTNLSGTANAASTTVTNGFRYELDILTPLIFSVAPSSGPNEGNTKIAIFGEAFQPPARVFFGSGNTEVELEVISVAYSQIIAVTPPAAGLGSGFLNSSVNMRVLNVASNKQVSMGNAFRYGPEIQITNVSPGFGSYLGGTRVTINGFGFDDPVAVSLGGITAQVIRVSGTEIIAVTTTPDILDCGIVGGTDDSVVVTNIETGASAANTDEIGGFTYIFTPPFITFVSPLPATEGAALAITVLNPGLGNVQFNLGGRTAFASPTSATSPSGETTFSITVPSGLEYDTADCTTGGGAPGTANVATDFELEFRNIITGCDAMLEGGITVTPLDTTCNAGPVGTISPSAIVFADQPEILGPTAAQLVTVGNIGSADLVILGITSSNAAVFATGPAGTTTITPNTSTTFGVTFDPTSAADFTGTITVSTNVGDLTVDVSGTGI